MQMLDAASLDGSSLASSLGDDGSVNSEGGKSASGKAAISVGASVASGEGNHHFEEGNEQALFVPPDGLPEGWIEVRRLIFD